jgi:hypothetical protein
MKTNSAILLFLCLTVAALAGGSIYQSDIEPLLGDLSIRWDELKQIYDIKDVGTAARIGGNVNPTLGGTRVLPFEFEARRKGSTGPYTSTIEIKGDNFFLDAHGKEVDVTQATAYKILPREIRVQDNRE